MLLQPMSDGKEQNAGEQPTEGTQSSLISQIWEQCLSSVGDDALPEDVRSRFSDLLKGGSPPTKEALERALYPPAVEP